MVPILDHLSAVLFDVDGTLIDSNAAHAETWAQALTEHGCPRDAAQVRPLIGMGSDKLLPVIAGLEAESREGRTIAQRKQELFAERLPRLQPTRGARALVAHLRERGKTLVVATSAGAEEMHAILRQAGVADLIPARTSSDDAEESKPDPDIVLAALRRAGAAPDATVMIGDTPYDIEAARRAKIDAMAFRCGGYWPDGSLGGALAILDDPEALLQRWR
ncbi:MAG TPA: HAD family hydrolase [Vicinamibacterales bacterium]|jgi:HAD superfamily hydrolase (TIGR01509 family)|nr:HAD family hydrolase [Vicinamibacterales bacterium]